jgi:membrane protein YdbS with pleckstrin-like domain
MSTFTNKPLSVADIPEHAQVPLEKVAPQFLKVMLWEHFIYWLLIAVPLGVLAWQLKFTAMLYWRIGLGVLAAGLLLFMLYTARKSFANMGYALRQHDLIFRKGWLFEQLNVVPLKKIQHCKVKRGPLERWYKVSSLRIYTAGGAGADVTLSGLPTHTANILKDWLTGSSQATFTNETSTAIADDTTMG